MVAPLISDRTRDQVRELLLRTMPDTCVIYEVEETNNSYGTTVEYTERDTAVCSFRTLTGKELERVGQIVAEADVVVKLPALTECKTTDRLVITRAEDGAIFDLEVLLVGQKSLEFAKKVYAKDLTPDSLA